MRPSDARLEWGEKARIDRTTKRGGRSSVARASLVSLLLGLLPLVASCSGGGERKAALNEDAPIGSAIARTAFLASKPTVGWIEYIAPLGKRDDVTLSDDTTVYGGGGGHSFILEDPNVTITAVDGCESLTPNKVKCVVDRQVLLYVWVELGDQDDRFRKAAASPAVNAVVKGGTGNDVLIGGDGFDDLNGGDGADQLRGQEGCDHLYGRGGSDFLDGGGGSDHLDGDAGVDTVDYGSRAAPLTVTIDTPSIAVNAHCQDLGNDGEAGERDTVYDGVENIWGGAGADILTGSAGANVIDGGPGRDRLDGGSGADNLVGGDGTDFAYYATRTPPEFPTGVTVKLDGVANDGSPSEGDNVFADVENVWGTSMNDTLVGAQSVANWLSGLAGDDTLMGGESPCGQLCASRPDYLDGGAGYDTIDYSGRGVVNASDDFVANDGRRGEGDNDVAFEKVIRDNIGIRP